MIRLAGVVGLVIASSFVGCSVCCTPYDDAYPAYGGKWQREDRYHGRVGSAFHPAGGMAVNEASYDEMAPQEPTPATPYDDAEVLPPTPGEPPVLE